VPEAATPRARGCNPACQRLQPRVPEAATPREVLEAATPRDVLEAATPREVLEAAALQPPYSYMPQVRGLPDLKMLGLPRNVLVWDGEQLGTWLDALG
jgi:hypothetical protein